MKVRRIVQMLMLAAVLLSLPLASYGQINIGIAVNIAPPVLPVYAQPICPGPNYIWTPGYWAWSGYDYYWVPGTWVVAPAVGLLWTPGYWGWGTGGYFWHAGYWGPHIGFYGGVNYGYGYFGTGFGGGYWRGNSFFYNTAISHVNTTVIRNVYVNKTVINNVNINRVSYNGGTGGINTRPNAQEDRALQERRMGPVGAQEQHQRFAQQDKTNFFQQNRGNPAHAALARPATSVNDFRNATAARPANNNFNRPANNFNRPANNVRPGNQPGVQRPAPVNRPAPQPRPETRPTPQPRPETRPAPQQRPQPQARPEARPQPRPEARPSEPHGDEHQRG
jgi:hypothetical protein